MINSFINYNLKGPLSSITTLLGFTTFGEYIKYIMCDINVCISLINCWKMDTFTDVLEDGASVEVVNKDLMKAFDILPHQRLLANL